LKLGFRAAVGFLLSLGLGTGLSAEAAPRTLTVICYHRFGVESSVDPYKISLERLGSQLDWLQAQGYQTVSLSQVAEALAKGPGNLPDKALILSVDDGYKGGALGAAVFEKHGFRGVYFVNPGSIGGRNFMDWDACRALEKRGHEVASHTLTHPFLTKPLAGQSPAQYKASVTKELAQARQILERELRHPVSALAYPYGAYNAAVGAVALRAGYRQIYSVSDGVNLSASLDARRLRRILLMGHPSQAAFERRMQVLPVLADFKPLQEGALLFQGSPPLSLEPHDPSLSLSVDGRPVKELPGSLGLGFHFLELTQGPRHSKLLFQIAPQAWAPYFKALTEN
jgi:peptidoglycan/xylan/chitin deacetylase (PgdA/CDA1 family)